MKKEDWRLEKKLELDKSSIQADEDFDPDKPNSNSEPSESSIDVDNRGISSKQVITIQTRNYKSANTKKELETVRILKIIILILKFCKMHLPNLTNIKYSTEEVDTVRRNLKLSLFTLKFRKIIP